MNNKITFPRLATMLAERSGRSKRFSEDFLREFFALISETLESQESVKIKGLGTFRLARVEPRRSVDVTTGEPMEISGHTKVVFTPSKELADAVNAPFEAFSAIEISDDANIEQLFTSEEIQIQNFDEDYPSDQDFDVKIAETEYSTIGSAPKDPVISFDIEDQETQLEDEYDIQVVEVDSPSQIESYIEKTVTEESFDTLEEEPEDYTEDDGSEEDAEEVDAEDDVSKEEVVKDEEAEEEDKSDNLAESAIPVNGTVTKNTEKDDAPPSEEEYATDNDDTTSNDSTSDDVDTADTDSEEIPSEISEELEEFEEENSRRKNWVKGLFIVFGAAVVALIATFAIWYFFATNNFNNIFKRANTTASMESTPGFVVGKNALSTNIETPDPAVAIDSLSDSIQESETEEEVPTAPSDVVVYDTISTTRYLTTMAKAHYGNYNLWPYIYQENQSFLGHPDRIRPGTPVVIPKLSKYGVDPNNAADVEKAKKLGVEIYARYGKKI